MPIRSESFPIKKVERETIEKLDAEITRTQNSVAQAQLSLERAQSARKGALWLILQQHGIDKGQWDHHHGMMVRDIAAEKQQAERDQAGKAALLETLSKEITEKPKGK